MSDESTKLKFKTLNMDELKEMFPDIDLPEGSVTIEYSPAKMLAPTPELRWFIGNTKPILQQKWRDLSNGEEHWEDVPEVRGEIDEL
jgi:hypothetical protein